ncbi:MAG: hypothetical protein OXC62_07655 [Aestuariivita sp.]|nr:hypothetical protein [Aestuariivita sp.]
MKTIILKEGLTSHGSPIQGLKDKDVRFLPGAQPQDPALLFSWCEARKTREELNRLDHTAQPHPCDEGTVISNGISSSYLWFRSREINHQ